VPVSEIRNKSVEMGRRKGMNVNSRKVKIYLVIRLDIKLDLLAGECADPRGKKASVSTFHGHIFRSRSIYHGGVNPNEVG